MEIKKTAEMRPFLFLVCIVLEYHRDEIVQVQSPGFPVMSAAVHVERMEKVDFVHRGVKSLG